MFDGHLEECDANPCPWCGEKASVYMNGSHVEGWYCFIECSAMFVCMKMHLMLLNHVVLQKMTKNLSSNMLKGVNRRSNHNTRKLEKI